MLSGFGPSHHVASGLLRGAGLAGWGVFLCLLGPKFVSVSSHQFCLWVGIDQDLGEILSGGCTGSLGTPLTHSHAVSEAVAFVKGYGIGIGSPLILQKLLGEGLDRIGHRR